MTDIVMNFHGPINHPATTHLRNAICTAVNDRTQGAPTYDHLMLLLNSTGGSLDDGLALYGFIRSLPIRVTTVNVGIVASIAIAPFLGGSYRICCPNAYFHFHNFGWNYPAAHTLTRLEFADHTQLIDTARNAVFELLESNTALSAEDFESLKLLEEPVIKDAAFAKDKGIVHEIGFPKIAAGTPMFNVDY